MRIHFFWEERIGGFIVQDVNFGIFLVDILVHGEILIISGLFSAIPKYVILINNELMVGKGEITAILFKAETNKLFHFVFIVTCYYEKV